MKGLFLDFNFATALFGARFAIIYAAVFAGLVALLGLVFYIAPRLGAHLSGTARVIMSRLMGMMAQGLKALLPGLA